MKPEVQGVVDRVTFHQGLQRRPSGHVVHVIVSADAHCTTHGDFRAFASDTSMPGTFSFSGFCAQVTIFCPMCGGQGAFDVNGKPL